MDQGDFVKSRYRCKYIFTASSTVKKGRVPIDTILTAGSWRSMKTFGRFYDKEIVERKVEVGQFLVERGYLS